MSDKNQIENEEIINENKLDDIEITKEELIMENNIEKNNEILEETIEVVEVENLEDADKTERRSTYRRIVKPCYTVSKKVKEFILETILEYARSQSDVDGSKKYKSIFSALTPELKEYFRTNILDNYKMEVRGEEGEEEYFLTEQGNIDLLEYSVDKNENMSTRVYYSKDRYVQLTFRDNWGDIRFSKKLISDLYVLNRIILENSAKTGEEIAEIISEVLKVKSMPQDTKTLDSIQKIDIVDVINNRYSHIGNVR